MSITKSTDFCKFLNFVLFHVISLTIEDLPYHSCLRLGSSHWLIQQKFGIITVEGSQSHTTDMIHVFGIISRGVYKNDMIKKLILST